MIKVVSIGHAYITVALLLLSPGYALASDISLEHFIGFNGWFQLGKWTPLTILIENRGRNINGILELDVTSGSEYRRDVYTAKHVFNVELPTNSRKKISFPIQLNSFSHPLIIRLSTGGKVIYTESVNLRSHYVKKDLALITDLRMSPDYLSTLPKNVHPVMVRPRFFPESWYGYDGVKMLIMHADAFLILGERQFMALKDWVLRGGYLVVSGGVNYGAFLQERVKGLLRIKIAGFKRLKRLRSLEKLCGQKDLSPNPFLVVDAHMEKSIVLLKEGDIPIIIQKDIGLGRVLFLAFDFQATPFRTWEGRSVFWQKVTAFGPKSKENGFTFNEEWVFNVLVSEIPSRFPGFIPTFALLLVYVILNHIFIKRIQPKNRLAWRYAIGLILTILVFTLVSYWLFIMKSAQKELTYNSFLHLNKNKKSSIIPCRQFIGLYALREAECTLSFSMKHRPITPVFKKSGSMGNDRFFNNLRLNVNKFEHRAWLSVGKWSHRLLKMDSMIDFPIEGTVWIEEQKLHLRINNLTDHNIVDCNLYFAEHFFRIGDIGANGIWEKQFLLSQLETNDGERTEEKKRGMEKTLTHTRDRLSRELREGIREAIIPKIQSRYHSEQDTLYFFGWVDANPLPIHFNEPNIKGEAAVLFEWKIPIMAGGERP